jgi:hypothetical protein
MLSYSPTTNSVSAFAVVWSEADVDALVKQLLLFKKSIFHPRFLPTLMASERIEFARRFVTELNDVVALLEKNTGVRFAFTASNQDFIANSQKAIRESSEIKARLSTFLSELRSSAFTLFEPIPEAFSVVEDMIKASSLEDSVKDKTLLLGRNLEDWLRSLEQERKFLMFHAEGLVARTDCALQAVRLLILC